MKNTPMRHDSNGNLIPWGSTISDVKEIDIDSTGWTAVSLSSDESCKSVLIGTRDNANWLLSATDDGSSDGYITIRQTFGMDLVGVENETLFWAKGTTDTTLEVLLID